MAHPLFPNRNHLTNTSSYILDLNTCGQQKGLLKRGVRGAFQTFSQGCRRGY